MLAAVRVRVVNVGSSSRAETEGVRRSNGAPLSRATGWFAGSIDVDAGGTAVRVGRRVDIRPVGGGAGCLAMIVVSVLASVVLTVLLNLLIR